MGIMSIISRDPSLVRRSCLSCGQTNTREIIANIFVALENLMYAFAGEQHPRPACWRCRWLRALLEEDIRDNRPKWVCGGGGGDRAVAVDVADGNIGAVNILPWAGRASEAHGSDGIREDTIPVGGGSGSGGGGGS